MSHAAKRNRVGHLPRWQRWPTHLILLFCALTGTLYFCMSELPWGAQFMAEHGHDLLSLHGISTYLVLMAFGAVLPVHIRAAWKMRKNRASGSVMFAVLTVLMLSGLGLYYGSEDMRGVVLWAHWIAGGIVLLAFPLHLFIGKTRNFSQH